MKQVILCILVVLICQQSLLAAETQELSVAVAVNLVYCVEALDAQFQKMHPEVTLKVMSGASGSLVAQIKEGAPYDVFLSADLDYPQALIQTGFAPKESLRVYAYGRLVLWTTRADIDLTQGLKLLMNDGIKKIAIANPELAPYGRAAVAAMQHEQIWEAVQAKIVIGENLSQATQFIQTGNADIGFVATSVVLSPKLKGMGHFVEIDPQIYPKIEQGAVITTRGSRNPFAKVYLDFLHSPEARKIFREYGYGLPPE